MQFVLPYVVESVRRPASLEKKTSSSQFGKFVKTKKFLIQSKRKRSFNLETFKTMVRTRFKSLFMSVTSKYERAL